MTQPLRKKGGLGRGLASLIPTGPAGDPGSGSFGPRMGDAAADVLIGGSLPDAAIGAVYREIPLADIEANPRQPRQVFDEEALSELIHSIREFGLLQPIVVRAVPGTQGGTRYQIVMGSGAGGRPRRLALPPSRPSCVRPATTTCCATPS